MCVSRERLILPLPLQVSFTCILVSKKKILILPLPLQVSFTCILGLFYLYTRHAAYLSLSPLIRTYILYACAHTRMRTGISAET
jgi:hypothetical protein